jgi:PRTRC genetic system protein A
VRPVGYLLNASGGLNGEPGLFYDYILAGNGLFLRGAAPLLKATILLSPARVRGLPPLDEQMELTHGKIPGRLYDLSLSIFMARNNEEQYLAITWEDEYRLRMPAQERCKASVKYENLPSSVMDIHSHHRMPARFSPQDNTDEQGLRLYMLVGRLDTLLPEVKIRLGVYGYFASLSIEDVFSV